MKFQPGSTLASPQRGGILSKLFFALLVAGAFFALLWVLFLPSVVERAVNSRTGFTLSTSTFSLNPFTGAATIKELRITNPTQFPVPDFVALPRLEGDVELKSLFSDRLVVEHAVLDLEALTLVRSEDGTLNAKLFGDRLAGTSEPAPKGSEQPPSETPPPAETQKPKEFLIKHLEVRIGKFRFEDYTGGKKTVKEVNVNLTQTYENVTSMKQLVTGPVLLQLSSLGSALMNVLPRDWNSTLDKGVESGRQLLKELGKKTSNALRSAAETLEEKSKP